jgi:hypothetical protein
MNAAIKFSASSLMVLALGAFASAGFGADTAGGCPCLKTYGTWNIPGSVAGVNVDVGQAIPFSDQEASKDITNSSGTFTLKKSGVYQVTFGVAPSGTEDAFDIELNGTPVSGGRIHVPNSPPVVTVMFAASAGDRLSVVNTGTALSVLGIFGDATAAYISILRIK